MEKWTIKEDSLIDLDEYGWACTVRMSGKEFIHVYAATKEQCLSRAKKICKVNEMEAALIEAKLQIEYMQEKFKPTGTGNSVLSRIKTLLKDLKP